MKIRQGRKPRKPYERPLRDKILFKCQVEQRIMTLEERQIVSREAGDLAKAGYHLLTIMEEDHAIISKLYIFDDDDDEGGDERHFTDIPSL